MKKFIYLIPFFLMACHGTGSVTSTGQEPKNSMQKEITITGTAEHSKAGAIVITEKDGVYYVEGKSNWDAEGYYKKKIRVTGTVRTTETKAEDLVNDKGEYAQGAAGEQKFIKAGKIELVK